MAGGREESERNAAWSVNAVHGGLSLFALWTEPVCRVHGSDKSNDHDAYSAHSN
jgi:hypothetical protein